jgi:hypothetical protein
MSRDGKFVVILKKNNFFLPSYTLTKKFISLIQLGVLKMELIFLIKKKDEF